VGDEPAVVTRDETRVMFRRAADMGPAIGAAFGELEQAIGSLRGRHFYGAFDPGSGEYRACVEWRDGDDAQALGLHEGTLPGGRYARIRLGGEPPGLYERIGPTFQRLSERPDHDPSRPSLEYYRRHDVVDLLLPIA
jgi:hypothetical protein